MGVFMTSRGNRIHSGLIAAASAAALLLVPAGARAAECFDRNTPDPKAGNATAVTGPEVGLQKASADMFNRPRAGQDVFTGDRVRTGADSHLQLKLCDWSTYTFSPDSESAIDEFYAADGARQRRVVNFFRGGFRLASGRNTQPGDTEVKIQDSGVTMGVRGTSVLLVEIDGVVYALLEGPIQDNNALQPKGETAFWNDENRDAIIASLRRPGWVVTIGPDGVSDPFKADADLLRRIYEAFVPVIPDEDGEATDYQMAGDPEDDSGQGTQEGNEGSNYASNDSQRESDDTTTQPEQGCGSTIPVEECEEQITPPPPPPPPPLDVGDILPLDRLEDFAVAQMTPDGHVLALVSAQLFVDSGTGPVLQDEGVALVQLEIDWANRTIAPEALGSFVKLDFSVSDPNDLTIRDFDFFVPDEIEDAYIDALLASANAAFASGLNNESVFALPLFTVTIRQGEGETVTVDVDVDFAAIDNQNNTFSATAMFRDLMVMPGPGELAFFSFDLGNALTPAEAGLIDRGGTATLSGPSFVVGSTLGGATELNGVAYAQLEVDFGSRTVGGGTSFLAIMAAADPAIGGATQIQYIPLNTAVGFDSGLFGLMFYPLSTLTSDPDLLKGQAIVANPDGLGGSIAAIVNTSNGSHLYTDIEFFENFSPTPLSTIAQLDAQSGVIESFFDVSVGTTFRYDGTSAGGYNGGFANLETAGGIFTFGTVEASIDINFANRTLGGGASFVSVAINDSFNNIFLNFSETLNAVGFDDAADGVGVFGFDGSDFSGSNIEAALLLLRTGGTVGAGEFADLYFDFNDGAGGDGEGIAEEIPITDGATAPPIP